MNHITEMERRGEVDFTRQRGFFDPTQCDTPVTIVGCGGIGSPLALALSKMGVPRLRLIDGDSVERHNLPNQLFPMRSAQGVPTIGNAKVDEAKAVAELFGTAEVEAHHGFVTEDEFPGGRPRGVVVLALDSIAARRMVYEKHLRHNLGCEFVVDPRLGGQSVVVHTLDPRRPDQCTRYEGTLFDPANAQPAPCTMRSIIDVGFVVASLAARAIRLHMTGQPVEHALFWNHRRLSAMVGRDEHEAELS